MDLGIKGRKAIVCASSQGLGKGCALALAHEGVELVINARNAATLEATAEEIRKATGGKVVAVASDITTREGREAVLAACPQPDILVNNAGGPPVGDFRDWDERAWERAVNDNMIAPIMLIRAVVDGMIARRFGRIVNITGFIAGLARQVAKHNVFAKARMADVPANRFGTPDEFGRTCAFLCSEHAGFIVGQNLLIDGGAVNATL